MSYTARDEEPGYHHVGTRGNNKQRIFFSDSERLYFLARLDAMAVKHDWQILSYCLMGNHYHLVLRIAEKGLARGMCELNAGYALQFNTWHERINHLFGKRYWNEKLDDTHLRNAIRYVVQNPRRAGVPGPLESHPWTSHAAAIGAGFTTLRCFARDELLQLFGSFPAEAVEQMKAFCEEPVPPRDG